MKSLIIFISFFLCIKHTLNAQDETITFDFNNDSEREEGTSFIGKLEHVINGSLHVVIKCKSPSLPVTVNFRDAQNEQLESLSNTKLGRKRDDQGNITFLISGNSIPGFDSIHLDKAFKIVVVQNNSAKKTSSTLFKTAAEPQGRIGEAIAGNGEPMADNQSFYKNTPNFTEPFKDAVSINMYLSEGSTDGILEIMQDYFPDGHEPETWIALKAKLEEDENLVLLNEILRDVSEPAGIQSSSGEGASASEGSSTSILTNPTILIDALAQLIANRFKEELSIAYLEKMKNELETLHLDKLLPQTYSTLTFQNAINYKSFLPLLREALHNDYTQAPDNLFNFIEGLHASGSISDPKLYAAIMSGLYIVKRSGDLPADILEDIVHEDFMKDASFKAHTEFLAALSRNLRADASYTGWIRAEELSKLTEGKTFQIFAALFFMHEKDLHQNAVVVQLRNDADQGLKKFFQIYRAVLDVQDAIETVDLRLSASTSNEIRIEAHQERTNQLGGVFAKFLDLAHYTGLANNDEYEKYSAVLNQSLSILKAAYHKEYGNVIHGLTGVMTTLGLDMGPQFMKYSSFAVSLLNAKTTEDAYIALETVAMPVGGYRVKRGANFSVTLDSYPGGFAAIESFTGGGYEVAENAFSAKQKEIKRESFGGGFTAPVGISFVSGGKVDGNKIPSSFGVFLSVIDIGSVVSFRLQENTAALPELKWSNFLAPGIYLAHGFKNGPLTLSGGVQYGPDLRELSLLTQDGTSMVETKFEANAWRAGISLTADVSLFSVFAGKKKE